MKRNAFGISALVLGIGVSLGTEVATAATVANGKKWCGHCRANEVARKGIVTSDAAWAATWTRGFSTSAFTNPYCLIVVAKKSGGVFFIEQK